MLGPNAHQACRKARSIFDADGRLPYMRSPMKNTDAQDLRILPQFKPLDPLILPLVLSLSKGFAVLHPSRLPQGAEDLRCRQMLAVHEKPHATGPQGPADTQDQ
jgi:hypothetical protein